MEASMRLVVNGWLGVLAATSLCLGVRGDEFADRVVVGAKVLRCDAEGAQAEGFAIKEGRFVAIGGRELLERWRGPDTEVIDLHGQSVTPGLCDSHLHFIGLGESLQRLDLRDVRNWDGLIEDVAAAASRVPPGTWVVGRGWHQAKWDRPIDPSVEGYPVHALLSARVPDHPVMLTHASGHACIANAKAMELAGVSAATRAPSGGEILRDALGQPTGVFRENAQRLMGSVAERASRPESVQARRDALLRSVQLAGQQCLAFGITSVHDAGLSFIDADDLGVLADNEELPVRMVGMIREGSEALRVQMPSHRWLGRGNGFLTIRSVKISIDGALGPHGAWLLQPYDDLTKSAGLNTVSIEEVDRIAELCWEQDWQLCVHAIGDRANRETLDAFERAFGGQDGRARRWRVEHAQHLHPDDIPRFAELGVIPVMQANHCTSDATFVLQRLGERRAAQGAYVWRSLIDSGCIIPNGTDAPVELVDPRASLIAAVTRRLPNGETFYPEQCMTRQEALWSYTRWPAVAAFQERELGSISPGMLADYVVWDTDLLHCDPEAIRSATVQQTVMAGRVVYELPKP
jgi:predicted amidohydrolase YtcJ